MNTYYVPGTVLDTYILSFNSYNRPRRYYPYFTDEEIGSEKPSNLLIVVWTVQDKIRIQTWVWFQRLNSATTCLPQPPFVSTNPAGSSIEKKCLQEKAYKREYKTSYMTIFLCLPKRRAPRKGLPKGQLHYTGSLVTLIQAKFSLFFQQKEHIPRVRAGPTLRNIYCELD